MGLFQFLSCDLGVVVSKGITDVEEVNGRAMKLDLLQELLHMMRKAVDSGKGKD